MNYPDHLWPHVVGKRRNRGLLLLGLVALVLLFSGGFVLGIPNIGHSLSWVGVAFGIASIAGVVRAGLVPTIGALWVFALWWYAFPPLVGYLTGNWRTASRYRYPRLLDYGYTSAYDELMGGMESGVGSGLLLAIFIGSVGYIVGTTLSWYLAR